MVRLVFWIDTKAGIGQSTFRQNDGHHEKEEKESKNSVIDNEPKNSNHGYFEWSDEVRAKREPSRVTSILNGYVAFGY